MSEYKKLSWEENIESQIPARYKKTKYEDVPNNIKNVFENMGSSRKGIFLWGGIGTGKTHIAYSLHKNAPKSKIKSYLVNTVELFKEMRDDIKRDAFDMRKPTDNLLKFEGVIIFDDIGVENATDFVMENLYLIINSRYNKMLPTIFTSNLCLDALADKFGDRIPSRIKEMCVIMELTGEDKRLNM